LKVALKTITLTTPTLCASFFSIVLFFLTGFRWSCFQYCIIYLQGSDEAVFSIVLFLQGSDEAVYSIVLFVLQGSDEAVFSIVLFYLQGSDEAISDLSSLSEDSTDHVKSYEDQLAHAVVSKVGFCLDLQRKSANTVKPV